MIRNLLQAIGKADSVVHDPRHYDWVIGCFQGLGGSWAEVYQGNVAQICLLKKILKKAIDRKIFPPAPKWDGTVKGHG